MISVRPRCDGCRRRDEECIPSSATRGDRTKCEGCRMRRVPCTTNYNSQNSTCRSCEKNREQFNCSNTGVDYDIELIRDDFNIFAPYRRYTTRSPVPPPRYDEPDPIVLVETLVNRATTPPSREIHPTRRPPSYDQFEREREEENEAMRLRGEAIRRSVQEEVDRREMDNRVPILEEEMNRSTIKEAGARIDSGGDYVMKEKNKEVETDARRLTSDVGEGGSSMIRKRRLDADVDSIQPKKSKKCRESKITDRFEKFYAMQLLILKKMEFILMKKILKNLRT
ncbi:hypothetical protein KEM48_002145 [Puccinia striiformis f. sp. tritici PST-130]|nr:hypothetical protein KEM48_002145 [Puccinia striiformis f. sp. tritici PST-130]